MFTFFDDQTILAVKAAMASGRPLLVCGEPGIGKTQLALAVASVLDCGFVYEVVNSKKSISRPVIHVRYSCQAW